jgi:1-acyl-sn-glycerol-3-phosphate acyltransferase
VDQRKVIYYHDELNEEFSTTVIDPRRIDEAYVYDRHGPVRALTRFFWYRIVAPLPALFYVKFSLHQKTVGRKLLRPFRKTGIYLYGNHTQDIGDPLTPNIFCFPKPVSFIVHPNNVSMKALGHITPTLGAIPLPDTMGAYRNFTKCIAGRITRGHAVVIYPEAHIWPYYTKIRNFKRDSFRYPVELNVPVYALTNTWQKRRFSKRPKLVSYLSGPIFPNETIGRSDAMEDLKQRVYFEMVKVTRSVKQVEKIQYIKVEK